MGLGTQTWSEIVEELGPGLYRYFLGSFPAQSSADLVQETFIRLLQKSQAGEIDPLRGTVKAFAFGIAKFIRLENLRKKSDFELVEHHDHLESVAIPPNTEPGSTAHLRWAISQLKLVEQEIILQMLDDENTFETISKNLNLPVGTVKSHVHRAKSKLRELMEEK